MKAHYEKAELNVCAQWTPVNGGEGAPKAAAPSFALPRLRGLEVLAADLCFGKNRSCHSALGLALRREPEFQGLLAPCGFLLDWLLVFGHENTMAKKKYSLAFLKASPSPSLVWEQKGWGRWVTKALSFRRRLTAVFNESETSEGFGNWKHLSLFCQILHRTGVRGLFF